MKTVEGITLWISITLYSLSLMAYIIAIFFDREKWSNLAYSGMVIGFLFQLTTITTRWIITGHPPVYGVYEQVLINSLAILIVFLILCRRYPNMNIFGVGVGAIALFMLGHGIMSGVQKGELAAPYKSNWLWVHVGFGQLAYGSFIISSVIAVGYLLKDRAVNLERHNRGIFSKLPKLSTMDELILKFVALGFVGHTGMIISGSIWASSLWGSYWSWEPLQTWSLIAWLIYGVFLHLRITLGWKGRRAAWMALFALVSIMFVFWGIGMVSNQHTKVL